MFRFLRPCSPWLALGLTAACLATSPVSADVPSWIAGDEGLPLWVSAEEAAPGSDLRWALLPDLAQGPIRKQLEEARRLRLSGRQATDSDPCILYSILPHLSPRKARPPESTEALAKSRALMLLGRVTDAEQGFYRGSPATVFEVAVERYLKLPKGANAPSHVYFVYRWAAIALGEDYLCVRAKRGEARPHLGSSVLLALEEARDLGQRWLLAPGDHEVFFTLPDGTTSTPVRYPDQNVEFTAITAALEAVLASPEGGR